MCINRGIAATLIAERVRNMLILENLIYTTLSASQSIIGHKISRDTEGPMV